MNTTELIEIVKECCSYPVKVSDYHWCGEGEFIFTEAGLNAFAQRIEAPHLQRIAELEQLREALDDALRYKRADEKLVDIINGIGQQQQKPKHGRQA